MEVPRSRGTRSDQECLFETRSSTNQLLSCAMCGVGGSVSRRMNQVADGFSAPGTTKGDHPDGGANAPGAQVQCLWGESHP